MGLDAKAKLVAGVKFGTVFQRKIETHPATRYDTITGIPYTIDEKKQVFYIKGVKCNHNNFPDKIYEIEDQFPEFDGLDLYYDNNENKEENFILGILITSTQSHRMSSDLIEEITLEDITNAITKAKNILKIDDVKIYNILYMSY
jgi:hypothetical protein